MSSQSGAGGTSTANAPSGGTSSISNNQAITASNSSKLNSKMSIDHQATLDKGLKMKIKRTKPGTKSSEAKHEIVKATEQQNGLTVCSSVGNLNADDASSGTQLNLPSSQSITCTASNSNTLTSISSISKKPLGSSGNQLNNTTGANSNITGSTSSQSLGTKRASSSHRREKAKEKSVHSNRASSDIKIASSSDKDMQDKSVCQCGDSGTSGCSSATCVRLSELPIDQRLSNSGSNTSSLAIPPGIFLPSADTHVIPVSSTSILNISSSIDSSQVITKSGSSLTNAPGPPHKESNSVKISAHIAAQLAATTTNSTSVSTLSNTENKITSGNTSQLNKETISATMPAKVHNTLTTKANPMCGPGTVQSGSTTPLPNCLTDERSVSPPPKRSKHNDFKISEVINVNKKDMVDICVGTSVGTITEPDCLGPCEPGTSVTLEGIVWHETEGGVLVVNVTWRGKTYVGTLLDCTRHDWAPPSESETFSLSTCSTNHFHEEFSDFKWSTNCVVKTNGNEVFEKNSTKRK